MVNGKAGDHPLTDILMHHLDVYGSQTDDMIRKIAGLSSERELHEWWEKEIGWTPDKNAIYQKALQRYQELGNRAKESGWETPS